MTVYPVGSDGNVAPSSIIGGPKTGFYLPEGVAVDTSGNIYVTNVLASSVTVYPIGRPAM